MLLMATVHVTVVVYEIGVRLRFKRRKLFVSPPEASVVQILAGG